MLDLPGLNELLRGLHSRELVARRGRDADRLAVRLLAAVRLRRDVHVRGRHAERRAPRGGAVARPRPAARAARPGGAARADRPRRARAGRGRPAAPLRAHARATARRAARRAAPRRRPHATTRSRDRVLARLDRGAMLDRARGRAARGAPARRRRGALDRRRRRRAVPRRASARSPPGGLPEAFLADVDGRAGASSSRRYARTHGPFTTGELRDALRRRSDQRRCAELERAGELVRGELRPGGSEREWCDPEVLRRLRRASLAALRKEIEAGRPARARRLPAVAGRASTAIRPAGAGVDRLREVLVPLQGLALPADVWERDVLPRRAAAPTRRPGWTSCAPAASSCGSARARSGATRAAWRCTSARTPRPRAAARQVGERARRSPSTTLLRERLAAGAVLLHRPAGRARRCSPEEIAGGAVGSRVGGRGDQRRLGAAARAAPDAGPRPSAPATGAAAGRALRHAPRRRAAAGPGPLVADHAALPRARSSPARAAGARRPSCCSSATASSPASRCSPRASRAASRSLYDALGQLETLGVCRRGYFVEGLGGAQFALPGAVERLRAQRDRRGGAADRARRHRPGAALRRGAAVAQARRRARPRAGPRAWPAPMSCSPAPSPCSTSSAAARASRCSSTPTTRALDPALEALADARHRRARAQALARARRRRAGGRLALGGAADRARLPRRARASSP